MREILFRGKRKDNNEWVYGNYVYDVNKEHYIHSNNWSIIGGYCEVIPETIGQYTGLKDKNGVKIFEGDLLLSAYVYENKTQREYEPIEIKYGEWNCGCCNWVYGYEIEDSFLSINHNTPETIECYIVGNIHDKEV